MTTVETATYVLRVRSDTWTAEVEPRDGSPALQVSLAFALDGESRDETLRVEDAYVEKESPDVTVVVVPRRSTRWGTAALRLRCEDDALVVTGEVTGAGTLTDCWLLGGRGVLPNGATGVVSSGLTFGSVFVPAPTEPVHAVRDASVPAVIGAVGDARAGRWHGLFSPAPLCFAFGPERPSGALEPGPGPWTSLGMAAPVPALRFPALRYEPVDGGFRIGWDYEGHTHVAGTFRTPSLVFRWGAPDPYSALSDHAADLVRRGLATDPQAAPDPPAWWREPVFCGWGAQCYRARAGGRPPSSYATQQTYDELLGHLAQHGITPGTVVVDDKWQATYGGCVPDTEAWPDLPGWIARRHAQGQRVLLWWKAWDPEGIPPDLCIRDAEGRPLALDASLPEAAEFLTGRVAAMLGSGSGGNEPGLDADGLKIDFTQRTPTGQSLRVPGTSWGIALLHRMLAVVHAAAHRVKPDALIVTHTAHPQFADVTDMLRLNDLAVREPGGRPVAPLDQMRFRAAVARAALPRHLVDTDDWPMPNRQVWRDYTDAKAGLGVPALYYAEGIDESGEAFDETDYDVIRASWQRYRDQRTEPGDAGQEDRGKEPDA